jgi:predicted nucleic acid-binding protein
MSTFGQASGNLVPDAHLAALALEHGCELHSTDSDFSRFPRLKWRNPLVK